MITLKIKDLPIRKLESELRKKDKGLKKELVVALDKFSSNFVGYAIRNARGKNVSKGLISRKASTMNLEGGLEAKSMAFYAPYLEFGTRGKVKIPFGWEALARQYKGNYFKSNVTFKKAIINWLTGPHVRKSEKEAEQLAFPVMMKIMRVGTAPQPFLEPAFVKAKIDLKKYINLAINKTSRL